MTTAMDRPIALPWWRERRWIYAGIAGIGALLVAVLLSLSSPERSLRVALDKITVSTVTHDFIPLRARVVPRETVYLDAIEGGRVERVLVEPGDLVTAGQPLVQLSNTELELNVLDREAQLIESLTQLQAYQTQLEQNRLNNEKSLASIDYNIVRLGRSLQRRKTLVSSGMESQETSESIKDELDYMLTLKPLQAESNAQQDALRVQQLSQIASQLDKLQKDIMTLLLWSFSKPVLWANVIAWPIAVFAMNRWLNGFAYRVDLGWWLLLVGSLLALAIALLTVSAHSYMVARSKPVEALRYE